MQSSPLVEQAISESSLPPHPPAAHREEGAADTASAGHCDAGPARCEGGRGVSEPTSLVRVERKDIEIPSRGSFRSLITPCAMWPGPGARAAKPAGSGGAPRSLCARVLREAALPRSGTRRRVHGRGAGAQPHPLHLPRRGPPPAGARGAPYSCSRGALGRTPRAFGSPLAPSGDDPDGPDSPSSTPTDSSGGEGGGQRRCFFSRRSAEGGQRGASTVVNTPTTLPLSTMTAQP